MIVPSGPPASGEPPAGLAAGVAPTPSEILDSALGPTTVPPLLAAPIPRPDDPPFPSPSTPRRHSWSELMRRVFAIDILTCPHCGGRRRLVALITDLLVARRILEHLGLPGEAPALATARPPPQATFGF